MDFATWLTTLPTFVLALVLLWAVLAVALLVRMAWSVRQLLRTRRVERELAAVRRDAYREYRGDAA